MNPSATAPSSASNATSSSSSSWFSGLVVGHSGKPNASYSSVRIAQTNPVTSELCRVLLKCGPKFAQKRHKVERELSTRDEVGWSKNVEVAKSNLKLASMNKKFGMIHGLSLLAIILSFGCLAVHF